MSTRPFLAAALRDRSAWASRGHGSSGEEKAGTSLGLGTGRAEAAKLNRLLESKPVLTGPWQPGNMLVTDDRLGGPVDIGYPCGAVWCLSVPDNSELCARRLIERKKYRSRSARAMADSDATGVMHCQRSAMRSARALSGCPRKYVKDPAELTSRYRPRSSTSLSHTHIHSFSGVSMPHMLEACVKRTLAGYSSKREGATLRPVRERAARA